MRSWNFSMKKVSFHNCPTDLQKLLDHEYSAVRKTALFQNQYSARWLAKSNFILFQYEQQRSFVRIIIGKKSF